MNILEISILRLIEMNKITNEGGQILSLLLKHKGLEVEEIKKMTNIDYDLIIENVVFLLSKNVIEKKNNVIMIKDPLESLSIFIKPNEFQILLAAKQI